MTTIYNCHHDGDQYRITKFVDGSPEGSYLTTFSECECPAGARDTCRHRQMLPEFIDRELVNTHLFLNWDHPSKPTCDFEGCVIGTTLRIILPPDVIDLPAELLTAEDIEALPDGLEKDYQHEMQTAQVPQWRRM
jgi:hypothetical protein